MTNLQPNSFLNEGYFCVFVWVFVLCFGLSSPLHLFDNCLIKKFMSENNIVELTIYYFYWCILWKRKDSSSIVFAWWIKQLLNNMICVKQVNQNRKRQNHRALPSDRCPNLFLSFESCWTFSRELSPPLNYMCVCFCYNCCSLQNASCVRARNSDHNTSFSHWKK